MAERKRARRRTIGEELAEKRRFLRRSGASSALRARNLMSARVRKKRAKKK